MKKYVLPLAAAILVAAVGTANAGKIYFTAYKDGKMAAVINPKTKKAQAPAQVGVITQAAYDKLSAARKKQYTAVEMCGEKYYLTKQGAAWKKAHEEANHQIRVRDNVKKGSYAVICPKEAAAPPPGDKKKRQ